MSQMPHSRAFVVAAVAFIFFLFNAFCPGCVEAERWSKTVADSSFAGMYVAFAPTVYGVPSLVATSLGVFAYLQFRDGRRVLSRILGTTCAVTTIAIWVFANVRDIK
ncbi:MAG: hypothetical protein EAZ21_14155 [Betaproteobacteria bacterium]|nr:MAG: hypothetical protein EAZ21_14155 [Betaproteobacteria bacterium]